MIRRPPRSTLDRSSAASDVYKRQERRDGDAGHDDGGHNDGCTGEWTRRVRSERRFRDVGVVGHDAGVERAGRPRVGGIQRERSMRAMGDRLRAAGNLSTSVSLLVRRSLRIIAWLVIGIGLSTNGFAQETTGVEQLVATALERSPEIRAARTKITAAGGEVTQAGLRPNPTFTASQMLMTGAQHQALFEVEWPLDLSRRQARVGAAQRSVEATTLAVQDRERILAAAVREQAGRLLA